MIPTSSSIRHRLAQLATDLPDTPVRQVMVGVHMTAVASKTVGCAYTFRDPVGAAHLCAEIQGAGSFRGSSARALARYAESDAFLERSIAPGFDQLAGQYGTDRVLARRYSSMDETPVFRRDDRHDWTLPICSRDQGIGRHVQGH